MDDLDALAVKFGGADASPNYDALAAKFGSGKPDPLSDPRMAVSGMSEGEQRLAGVGQGLMQLWNGLKERAGLMTPADIDALRRLDAPLLSQSGETTASVGGVMGVHRRAGVALSSPGGQGSVIGQTAPLIPLMAIPGANTIAGGALIGAGTGFLQPTGTSDSVLGNTLKGAATGAAIPTAISLAPAVVKAVAQPFYNAGRENIVGDVLNRFGATGDITPAATPGWKPTLAEATQSPGAAILQKGAGAASPDVGTALAERQVANNAAAAAKLNDLSGTAADQNLAVAIRDYMSKPLYAQAEVQGIDPAMAAYKANAFANLMNRPSIAKAASRVMDMFGEQAPQGTDIYSVRGLQMLKQAMDDIIEKAGSPLSSIGSNELAAMKNTRSDLVALMQDVSPTLRQADMNYATFSRPINEANVIEGLKQTLVPALTDQASPTRMKAATFANTLRDLDAKIPQLSGYPAATAQNTMSPGAMTGLNGVLSDLTRRATADDLASLARGGNSATSQNLATQNLVRNIAGPIGLPDSLAARMASSVLGRTVGGWGSAVIKPAEQEIQQVLGRALLDPAYAQRLSALATQPGSGLPLWLQRGLNTIPVPVRGAVGKGLSTLALPAALGYTAAQSQ